MNLCTIIAYRTFTAVKNYYFDKRIRSQIANRSYVSLILQQKRTVKQTLFRNNLKVRQPNIRHQYQLRRTEESIMN